MEVVVIGGGVVGAAATLALSRRGAGVALIERSSLLRAPGSSAGTARIYAPAAYPDESYLEMGLRALERWREIEARWGHALLARTGALSRGGFAERQPAILREAAVEAELLTPAQARERFAVSVPGDAPLLHQPDAGIVRADRARGALLALARAAGAELCEHECVRSIVERGEGLEVETERRRWRCSTAVVAAGPWTRALLAEAGIEVALGVSSQSVAYFDARESSARPVALIEYDGEEPYALWDPARGLKAAFHARGAAVGDASERAGVEPEVIERVAKWVGARYRLRDARPTATQACLYTNTVDERFMIERRGGIVVVSACNGHGFQLAPETGERAARLALEAVDASQARA